MMAPTSAARSPAVSPPLFSTIRGALVSHSSQHSDLSGFKGRKVAVLGAGSWGTALAKAEELKAGKK